MLLMATGCADDENRPPDELGKEKIESLAAKAYAFAYPMLEFHKFVAGQVDAGLSFNTFLHRQGLATHEDREVVRPNADTLYSGAILDLSAEPLVLTVPVIDNRYYSFQLIDVYTHNAGYVGTRATGTAAGHHLISGPGWDRMLPDGIDSHIVAESRLAFLLGASGRRVLVVSSGGSISAALQHILDLPAASMVQLNLQTCNTGLHRCVFNDKLISLSSFNNTPHLDSSERQQYVTYA